MSFSQYSSYYEFTWFLFSTTVKKFTVSAVRRLERCFINETLQLKYLSYISYYLKKYL